MRKFCYILIFLIFCLNTKAQKYGVSIGYAYSLNAIKFDERYQSDINRRYKDVSSKQLLFPNLFLRPYVRLHNRISLFTGADLLRFKFRCTENIYSTGEGWVPQLYKINELHIPFGLRFSTNEYKEKHTTLIYGGIFWRYLWGKEWINPTNSEPNFSNSPHKANISIIYSNQSELISNFIIGIQHQIKLNNYSNFSFDTFFKYIPTSIDSGNSGAIMNGLPNYYNKFSFHLAIGITLMKPPKQKEEEASKVFRLDD